MSMEIAHKAFLAVSALIDREMKSLAYMADDAARRYVQTDDPAVKADWAKYTYARDVLGSVQRQAQREISDAVKAASGEDK